MQTISNAQANRARKTGLSLLAAIVTLATSASALAQGRPPQIDDVDVDTPEKSMQKTPEFAFDGATDKRTPNSREWLEIDVKFQVNGESESDYIDQLVFRYFIVLDDQAKTMLTKTVNHVNIPLNEEVWSSIYLSPSTLAAYFGKDRASERSVAGIGIEVLYQGRLVGGHADPAGSWWNARAQVPDILRSKDETPYALLWWDRYAEISSNSR